MFINKMLFLAYSVKAEATARQKCGCRLIEIDSEPLSYRLRTVQEKVMILNCGFLANQGSE